MAVKKSFFPRRTSKQSCSAQRGCAVSIPDGFQTCLDKDTPGVEQESGSPVSCAPFPPELPCDPSIDPVSVEVSMSPPDLGFFCVAICGLIARHKVSVL